MIEVWSTDEDAWVVLETDFCCVHATAVALDKWAALLPSKLLRSRPPGDGYTAELLDRHS